jgi:hypothetical protein
LEIAKSMAGRALDIDVALAGRIVPASLQLPFSARNQRSVSEFTNDSVIALASGRMELKNRHRELGRAPFSAFIVSSQTVVLMRAVALREVAPRDVTGHVGGATAPAARLRIGQRLSPGAAAPVATRIPMAAILSR